jgi:two-component system, OmpR family, alkaline phosphatase synthesis response regulator PhoP
MSVIANNPASPLQPVPVPAVGKDSSPSIRIMDLSEMRRLSDVTKFLVFIAAPRHENETALPHASANDFSTESSATLNLLELVRKTVTQPSDDHSGSDVTIGDVKVNFVTMEADRGGESLFLTALEFKTLRYLVENPRRVVSRDELLNEVWGYQNYPSTRTVDNQVAKLRKKLEADPARPVHLRTVHGVGYKFLP